MEMGRWATACGWAVFAKPRWREPVAPPTIRALKAATNAHTWAAGRALGWQRWNGEKEKKRGGGSSPTSLGSLGGGGGGDGPTRVGGGPGRYSPPLWRKAAVGGLSPRAGRGCWARRGAAAGRAERWCRAHPQGGGGGASRDRQAWQSQPPYRRGGRRLGALAPPPTCPPPPPTTAARRPRARDARVTCRRCRRHRRRNGGGASPRCLPPPPLSCGGGGGRGSCGGHRWWWWWWWLFIPPTPPSSPPVPRWVVGRLRLRGGRDGTGRDVTGRDGTGRDVTRPRRPLSVCRAHAASPFFVCVFLYFFFCLALVCCSCVEGGSLVWCGRRRLPPSRA